MQFARRRPRTITLNMTPLIDVVLVLIVFFLLTTTFVLSPGIHVDLPDGGTTQRTDQSDAIVAVTRDGEVYYQDEHVNLLRLRTILRQAQERQPQLRVVIKADKAVPHGRVVEVMNTAKAVGIARLAIGTTPESAQ